MSSSPSVSFIIPAYQARETLNGTLASVRAQTWQAWEAIIVDDGSKDGTLEEAHKAAAMDGRIRVLSQANAGVSVARNTGLAAAQADWIAFLDSDDTIEPDFLETLLAKADQDTDVVYCGHRRVRADGVEIYRAFAAELADDPFGVAVRYCPLAIHGALTRRASVVACGGFDPALRTCEDWDLWQRLARSGARFRGVEAYLALYHVTEDSLSADPRAILRDCLAIGRQGFGPDPRVKHPRPDLAAGADPSSLPSALASITLWYAAIEVGQGGDGAALLTEFLPSDIGFADLDRAASGIMTGVAIGRQVPINNVLPMLKAAGELARLLRAVAWQGGVGGALDRLRELEDRVLARLPAGEPMALSQTLAAPVELRNLQDLEVPAGVSRLRLTVFDGETVAFVLECPSDGSLDAQGLAELLGRECDETRLTSSLGTADRLRFFSRCLTFVAKRRLKAFLRMAPKVSLTALRHRARAQALMRLFDDQCGRTVHAEMPKSPSIHGNVSYWDNVFVRPDPWRYRSPYEQIKYDYTLGLLPAERPKRAMELGCAEGVFTTSVASRVDHLIAADISARAIQRARDLCDGLNNTEFRKLDMIQDELPKDLDLVVCSEVLYYLSGPEELAKVCGKLCDSMSDGGLLITANALVLRDDPTRTGFDWNQDYGGLAIRNALAATPGLHFERAIETELYWIDCFRKAASASAAPCVEKASWGEVLDLDVERCVVWGGASATRTERMAREETWEVPVLAYHRVADEGPEGLADWRVPPAMFREHMRRLRSLGFYSVTSADILAHRRDERPFPGRPILITFDDAYEDFATQAWPILQRSDFTAEVFVVTDRVGGNAIWDANEGPPAPLMDWETIKRLHGEGVTFGSHMATHTSARTLTPEAILEEARRSREALEGQLLSPIFSIAAPFGHAGPAFNQALGQAGYKIHFTCEGGFAHIQSPAFDMRRITVMGDWSADDLTSALKVHPAVNGEPSDELVSVIVPAYNAEATLDETLRSVRGQTHSRLEIIVVDDGSRDRTVDIIRTHAAADPRVRLVQQVNGGVARARNHGIQEARGDLIAPIDADDLWAPAKLEQQLKVLKAGGLDMGLVYSWFAAIDEHSAVIGYDSRSPAEGCVIADIARSNFIGNGSSPLMRKAAVLACGGYDPSLRDRKAQGCEDLLLYFRIAERYTFGLVRDHSIGYRQLEGAMSGDAFQMLRSQRLVAREILARHPEHRRPLQLNEADLALWLFWKARRAGRKLLALRLALLTLRRNWRLGLRTFVPLMIRALRQKLEDDRPAGPRFRIAATDIAIEARP